MTTAIQETPIRIDNDGRHAAILKAAAMLRSHGFGICRLLAGEKNPVYAGWSKVSLEPSDFEEYPDANLVPLSNAKPFFARMFVEQG
jgi:hypothetical protein